jgi:hypothetical protein
MRNELEDFYKSLIATEKKLKGISEVLSRIKPSENKWSSKEIMGHLIDSSINNTVRFVSGQFTNNLIFNGYEQNKWINSQNYQTYEWNFLIELWKQNNLHIAKIVENIPDDIYLKKFYTHNFDKISWKKLPKDQAATIQYMFIDYFGHMEHHLKQIFTICG